MSEISWASVPIIEGNRWFGVLVWGDFGSIGIGDWMNMAVGHVCCMELSQCVWHFEIVGQDASETGNSNLWGHIGLAVVT